MSFLCEFENMMLQWFPAVCFKIYKGLFSKKTKYYFTLKFKFENKITIHVLMI